MPDAYDLYPKSPAPAANALTNPVAAIGLLNAINQNRLQSQEIFARDSAADVYKGAVGPDGVIDNPLVMKRLGMGAGGYLAPQLATNLQSQEQQRLATETARIQQGEVSRGIINSIFGSLNPDADPRSARAALLRQSTMFPPEVLPSRAINGAMREFERLDPAGRRRFIVDAQRQGIGGTGLAEPTPLGVAPTGAQRVGPRGQFLEETAPDTPAAAVPGGGATGSRSLPATLAPGESKLMEDSAARFSALKSTAGSSPQIHADFSNLLHDSRILGNFSGPTVEIEKRLNTLAQRLGVKEGFTLGSDKLAAAESFDKIVSQLASNQQKQMSDAGLNISQAMNPSLAMSQVGREGVINMLRGNQDAVDRIRTEASKAKIPAGQYDQWMQTFGPQLDVRVFQFNRMNKDQKQKFLDTMAPEVAKEFATTYNSAAKKGWLP